MQYYIRIRGKTFGPFDENQLKEMRVKGKLGQLTEVSENKINWQSISELTSLFQPLSTSSEITSSDSTVHSLMLPTSPDTNISRFRIRLPFIAICTFFLLIITVFGLIGFIFLTKDNSSVTSKESKK
jgi:hypothetical protein